MKEIEIEDNVPIPTIGSGYKSILPFDKLEVGQSFFAPGYTTSSINNHYYRYVGKKFSCRTRTENGVKGARVWRVM